MGKEQGIAPTREELLSELLALVDYPERPEGDGWYTALELAEQVDPPVDHNTMFNRLARLHNKGGVEKMVIRNRVWWRVKR